MHIKIIGKGCYFCHTLHKIVEELIEEMDWEDVSLEETDDMDELLDLGVVNPPALIVNGKLKMMGRVLVKTRIKRALEEEASGR